MGRGWGITRLLIEEDIPQQQICGDIGMGRGWGIKGCLQKKTYLNSKYVVTLEWGKDGVLKAAYRRRHTSTVNMW